MICLSKMETMTTALSTLSVLPNGKEEIKKFSRMLKDEILQADRDPLKILVQLKYIEKVLEDVLKDEEIDRHFCREFDLYGKEKVLEVNGARLQQTEVGTKYLYEECSDPIWFNLKKQHEELTEKKKEREKFLQNIPYNEGIVDPDTGVFITRAPKTSKTKVKCTL
jgi:hypothetical protein